LLWWENRLLAAPVKVVTAAGVEDVEDVGCELLLLLLLLLW